MPWPQLYEAKKRLQEIAGEIDKLIKEHNSLTKREIAQHRDKLLSDIDESVETIDELCKDFMLQLKNHRKQLEARARFLRRHNSRTLK